MRKQFDLIRQGGRVQRFHAKPLIHGESVAEHSFYVAWVTWMYGVQVNDPPSAQLLMSCLQHDLAEAVVGDIPSPTKRIIGKETLDEYERKVLEDHDMLEFSRTLSPKEKELLKFADNLAGYMKALQEAQMGNRYLQRTQANYLQYLRSNIAATKYLDTKVLERMITIVEGETDVH